ncbi:MAG: minor capsid protein [Lentisphaerae bacterium]|nr:minor capsid protein [Lentisphaerota bacterium]
MNVILKPLPYREAEELIRGKPAVTRRVFDRMVPEVQARAFVVAGLNDAAVLQEVRDRIADLPAGANWDEVKKDVAARLPYRVDPDADPEEREQQAAAAYRKAELLLRVHGFEAYMVCHHEAMMETRAAFPFWQYITAGDGRVRDAHAVLNGTVLPADSPFWNDHFPPWDWSCRCDMIQRSPEDVAEIRAEDEERNPEDRQMIEGKQLERLENDGELTRGPIKLLDPDDPDRKKPMLDENGVPVILPGARWNLSSPLKTARSDTERAAAFSFDPSSMRLPIEQLSERYEPEVWAAFVKEMQGAELLAEDGSGSRGSVWDWLSGAQVES